MSRPRIIIADTDVNYILSLQVKFIEEFFEKVDLEIITNEDYFNDLFSVPQKADILVVSEDLYSLSLQKHSLAKVFLMTEQYEEEQTADLNITRIFKYTSIKEIFNEILGKSANVLHIENDTKQEPQIIVVTSASGGVGKTTVAMGISVGLTKNYKKVLYINAEQLQTYQYLMQNKSSISSIDVYRKLMSVKENIYSEIKHLIRTEVFSYVPPFKSALMSIGIPVNIFSTLAAEAKKSGDFDFIVIDTDSVFDDKKAELLNRADKVVFVTKQNRMSVLSTNLLVSNINGSNSDKYSYICNDFDVETENSLISPECSLKYSINEYIEHIPHYDQLKCADLVNCTSFLKIIYLFI